MQSAFSSSGDKANVNVNETQTEAGVTSVHRLSDKNSDGNYQCKKQQNIKLETEHIKYQNVQMSDWIYQCEHKPGFSMSLY